VYHESGFRLPIRPARSQFDSASALTRYSQARVVFGAADLYCDVVMKPPELYSDWRIVAGIVLILLGTGNWLVGLNGIVQYRRLVVATSPNADLYRNFDELDARTDGAVLAPLTQDERTVSYAAAQMDFYHAVYLTGCILFALGLMISLMAFIGAIRRDAREAVSKRARELTPYSDDQTFASIDPSQNQPLPAHNGTPS
jgi:hypothetical protein